MLDSLAECEAIDLYLDNDATGEKCTINFMRLAQLFHYCIQNGLPTDWDLKALRGSRDKTGKLIANLKIEPSEVVEIWKIPTGVSDQRYHYTGFEDVNAFFVGEIQK